MLKRCVLYVALTIAMAGSIPSQASPLCSEEIQRGVASWYGPGFEGAMTKSEEIFNPSLLSAAHPDLPFGTVIKVTNLRNHRSVNVRVNDRGAFSKERVIDVSTSAANELGMIDDGTAPVAIFRCNN
jgi:rare lipoprotein A